MDGEGEEARGLLNSLEWEASGGVEMVGTPWAAAVGGHWAKIHTVP